MKSVANLSPATEGDDILLLQVVVVITSFSSRIVSSREKKHIEVLQTQFFPFRDHYLKVSSVVRAVFLVNPATITQNRRTHNALTQLVS